MGNIELAERGTGLSGKGKGVLRHAEDKESCQKGVQKAGTELSATGYRAFIL